MPDWVAERLARSFDAHILVLGLAYKKNVADLRESPSLVLIEALERRGARVDYHDPLISSIMLTRDQLRLAGRQSVPWDLARIAEYVWC